ncbi:hypothetical protein AAFX60_019900 [Aliivibrio fischeri]
MTVYLAVMDKMNYTPNQVTTFFMGTTITIYYMVVQAMIHYTGMLEMID